MVFLQPKASKIKTSHGVCLLRAFGIALWSGLTGKKPPPPNKKQQAESNPLPTVSVGGSSQDYGKKMNPRQSATFPIEEEKLELEGHEEEKTEIQNEDPEADLKPVEEEDEMGQTSTSD